MRTAVLSILTSLCVLSAGPATAQDAAEAPLATPQLSPIETGSDLDVIEETAAETETPVQLVDLAPLSNEDVSLYQEIFELQRDGNWDKADRLIRKLDNDILMGHVLYERYMHPTAYTSRYRELANWMLKYPDHPGAKRIYDLAVKKNGGKNRRLHKPVPLLAASFPADKPLTANVAPPEPAPAAETLDPTAPQPNAKRSKAERVEIANLKKRIRRYLRRQNAERAEKRLWAFERLNLLTREEFSDLLTDIAQSYYFKNQDEKAYALALIASDNLREKASQADWVAGLAAWRLGDCVRAADHFEKVAFSPVAGDWVASAGAYWGARANTVCRQPERVRPLLAHAAKFNRTFYGLIAEYQLGQTPALNWNQPEFNPELFANISSLGNVQRAIALAQVKKTMAADMELSDAWRRTSGDKHAALLGLASTLGLAGTQLKIGKIEEQKRLAALDSTLYPLPDMEPEGGFVLDRALLFAIVRQESEFNSWAKSSVGARGIMQVMPRTASYIARDRSLRSSSRIKLDDPRYNMALGQKYLVDMMSPDYADGDLFKTLTAYNAGPGNLRKWMRKTNFQDDPLLYIESIPARETRHYIEKVLSNYWIYRMRFGQDTPSLKDIASGDWPLYQQQEDHKAERQRHARR
ncbi:lytic transglycosylase domain-containing protein [Emcibacter nanhaiensis]|uniref:Lytic transglycosylase domain-containing protein n=1 Tax=Emcibacter nanhaiensis TaxID=1505037 RepID=A0A501PGA6_9PROT|nr:lytic transglycosylase domain-containing protein [Emcibacter nanhaiensis]TPD59493.1 lytic transglycosylase domain-containing protein [Emcibacter nanhaiensis]